MTNSLFCITLALFSFFSDSYALPTKSANELRNTNTESIRAEKAMPVLPNVSQESEDGGRRNARSLAISLGPPRGIGLGIPLLGPLGFLPAGPGPVFRGGEVFVGGPGHVFSGIGPHGPFPVGPAPVFGGFGGHGLLADGVGSVLFGLVGQGLLPVF